MVATFCLRLACGLILALLVLVPSQVPPRFFRVQYLTALGLVAAAMFFLRDRADLRLWLVLVASMGLAFTGSVIWHVNGAPGQRIVLLLTNVALISALLFGGHAADSQINARLVADDIVSAAVLGGAMSAMLMGHSYLIAPAMTLSPLYRLLGALAAALFIRIVVACLGVYWWTARPAAASLETETLLWLCVRWLVGLIGPLVLGWMAWESARLRSTQSATGILYVVVILVFLGELTGQLLIEKTGFIL